MLIQRKIQKNIEEWLWKGKILIIYGPRQVGKTTLVQKLLDKYPENSKYYLGDLLENKDFFSYQNASRASKSLANLKLVVIDEAQQIENIGLVLKIIHDQNPELQLIVTGSSSFDLANKINEPLTGRQISFKMYTLAVSELFKDGDQPDFQRELPNLLVNGLYPEVYQNQNDFQQKRLSELATTYLFKDIFTLEKIKNPQLLENLLRSLALQLGNEVSLGELSNSLNADILTIDKYLKLLEQAFIVFKLPAFSRNLRKEISKSRKIYFWDLGIRNSLIPNFNLLNQRNDLGALWENFCVLERRKNLEYSQKLAYSYFWRTYDQQEIDYVEEAEDALKTFEFKWNSHKKSKFPEIFQKTYPNSTFQVIHPDNFLDWGI